MSRPNDTTEVYLLRVFGVLMDERSLARAATRLGRSRDAIDTALRRLRVIFDDPLLLRDGHRLAPTERALALEASLRLSRGRTPVSIPPVAAEPLPESSSERLAPLLLDIAANRLIPSRPIRHRGVGLRMRWW